MSRRPTTLAYEESISPALVHALRKSEAALEATEARLAETQAVVERQARDLAALKSRQSNREHAPPDASPPHASSVAELEAAQAEIGFLKAELTALRGSTSWRVTAPLRAATGLVRR